MYEIDPVDRRILVELQRDGRMSNVELAQRIGIAPTSLGDRLRRLTRDGLILGYSARLDPHQIGLGMLVFVEVLLDKTTDDVSSEARELVDSASGAGVLVLVLIVCVGAPIAEELFYRGLVLRSVERRWSTPVAVVASTVLFGVVHLQGLQLPALLLIGAVLALLTVRSDRLGPAILCHSGFNACTLFVLLVLDP